MPMYAYTARDRQGRPMQGDVEAGSQDSALASLQGKGLLVVAIGVKITRGIAGASRRRKLHQRASLVDKIMFCRQLSTLLNAGVPLLRSLEVLQNQLESRALHRALGDVTRDVEGGSTFRDALMKHPHMFSPFWINIVETGEASGHLGNSMDQLATYMERTKKLRDKLWSAMLYPAVLIVIATLALVFFVVFVIPMFQNLYSQFDATLPPLTNAVLHVGGWMQQWVFWIALVLAFAGWGVKQCLASQQGQWLWDRYSLRIPVLGTLLYDGQIAKFATGLGTLLESGVPLLFGLEILERSADNQLFGQALQTIKSDVREGKSMAAPMEATGLFPPMVVQMVQVGEEIGELGTMLERVAAYYEEVIDTLTERLAVLFEPIALVCVGSLVGFLVVALFLPLFSLSSAVR